MQDVSQIGGTCSRTIGTLYPKGSLYSLYVLQTASALKMQKTKTIGLVLVAILATATIGNFVYAAPSSASKIPDYIATAEKARDQAKELANLAQSKGVNASKALAMIDKGSAALEEAKSLLSKNETAKAIAKTHQAMAFFSNAIMVVDNVFMKEVRKDETVKEMLNLITRLESRIKTIGDEVAKSNVSQSVKDDVNKHLDAAQKHLDTAKAALTAADPNVDTAAKEIRGANQEIQQAIKTYRDALDKRPASNTRGRHGKDDARGLDLGNDQMKELDSILKNAQKNARGPIERQRVH